MNYINTDLKVLDGENEYQYLWRIGQAVSSGVYKNWAEITPIINRTWRGEDESKYRDESAYRKPYQYAEKYYDNVFSKWINDEYSNSLEAQKKELEKERQKLYATKIEYNRLLRQQSRFELFYENIKNEIVKLTPPEFKLQKATVPFSKQEHVLTIADIHAGANFDIGINKYSLDEMKRRFEELYNKTVEYIKKNMIYSLKIVCLGDCVQGILRLSDLAINETTVIQSVVMVSKLMAELLNKLSEFVRIDYYHCPTSNHSQTRPLGSKAGELGGEDVEYIIANYIKDVLERNENVVVHTNFGEEYIEIPILRFKGIAIHGHQIGDINNAVKTLSFQNKVFYDVLFMAHYHAGAENISGESEYSDVETLTCPSFVGTCPYAKRIFKGAKPAV